MNSRIVRFAAAALVMWPVVCHAQTAVSRAPAAAPRKQLDIGAATAPLSDAERTDLDAAVKKHDYAAEKAVIDKARGEHQDSFDLLVMWGRLAYLEKQPKDAAEALERADKIKALSETDRLTLALAYEFSDKTDQSRAEMQKLVKLAPANAQYPYQLGRLEAQSQRLEEAEKDFAQAVRIDPTLVRVYEDLGKTQEALGRMEAARKTYEDGAAINRGLKSHWEWSPLDLGVVLLEANDLAGAEKLFREALQYSPRSAWGHYYMGQLLQKRDRNADAIAEYKAAVVGDPRLKQAWYALGRLLKQQGDEAGSNRSLAIFKRLEEQENAAKGRKN